MTQHKICTAGSKIVPVYEEFRIRYSKLAQNIQSLLPNGGTNDIS